MDIKRIDVTEAATEVIHQLKEEYGDLMFALINYARFLNINPEDALEKTNRKFIQRFQHIEKRAVETGQSISNMTLAEMEVFWQEAKHLS